MIIRIDTENKIIYVRESIELQELIEFMQKKFVKSWNKFKICADTTSVPCHPWIYTSTDAVPLSTTLNDIVPTTNTGVCETQPCSFGTSEIKPDETQ